MAVVELQVAADSVLAFAGAAVSAAAQLFFGQGSEPALDQVEPGSAGRREVQVEARMAQQPALDRRGFVGGGVIDDQMELAFAWHGIVDGLQKLAELDGPMPLMQRRDYGAGFDVERGEQVG